MTTAKDERDSREFAKMIESDDQLESSVLAGAPWRVPYGDLRDDVVRRLLSWAIREALSPDPHLGEPHPETVAAVAEFVRLMCEVSKRRRHELANEPWLSGDLARHFEHAQSHAELAYGEDADTGQDVLCIDDDGLPHAVHAGLRLAFGVARVAQSSSSSSEGPDHP